MADSTKTRPVIESRDELAAWMEEGCKPRSEWRIGTEHEKFGFHTDDLSPLPYDGPHGVRALLEEIHARFGWEPMMEEGRIIGLKHPECPLGGTVTLEPGGQFELSGAPLETIHQTCGEVNRHLEQVRAAGNALGIGMIGLGFSPKWTLEETPRMPKSRYAIMSAYMPTRGGRGLDMMYRSATVQVNLDFSSESDMVMKMRVGLALQPVATALFANSPFANGKPNGYLSLRGAVWQDTDPDRTGLLPFVFEDGMSFERYVDYALDVPMYFVYRDGIYHDVAGQSFRTFLEGKLEGLTGVRPTLDDWSNHLTTLFPEVRLKRYIEMRGADGGPWRRLCALPALWTGLLYDDAAMAAAWDLARDWTVDERDGLRAAVTKEGLAARIGGRTMRDIAADTIEIAQSGLKARARRDYLGDDESVFLNDLKGVVDSGRTHAEELLDQFHNKWNGDIDNIFKEHAY